MERVKNQPRIGMEKRKSISEIRVIRGREVRDCPRFTGLLNRYPNLVKFCVNPWLKQKTPMSRTLDVQAARRIWLPREHGAWAMTFVPLLIGFLVAGRFRPVEIWLTLSVLAFFFLRQPTVVMVRSWKRGKPLDRGIRLLFAIESAILFFSAGMVLWLQPTSIWLIFGLIASVSLLMYLFFVSKRQEMSPMAEVITVVGVDIGATAGYFAATGRFVPLAGALFLLNLAYFVPNIFFVRLKARFQAKRKPPESWLGCLAAGKTLLLMNVLGWIMASSVVLAGWISPWALLALLPNVLKDIWGVFRWHTRTELDIRRLGFGEVGHVLLFIALLTWLVKMP